MDKERVDVADSEIPRRHALPAGAAVRAHAKTGGDFRATIRGWCCAVEFAGIIGGNQAPGEHRGLCCRWSSTFCRHPCS